METKEFALGEILYVITSGLRIEQKTISYMQSDKNILNFMTGKILKNIHQSIIARRTCREHLLKQLPRLNSLKMNEATNKLISDLNANDGQERKEQIAKDWLAEQIKEYGETLKVESLPSDVCEIIDKEIKEMADFYKTRKHKDDIRLMGLAGIPEEAAEAFLEFCETASEEQIGMIWDISKQIVDKHGEEIAEELKKIGEEESKESKFSRVLFFIRERIF